MTLHAPDLLATLCGICLGILVTLRWRSLAGQFLAGPRPDAGIPAQYQLEHRLISALPFPLSVRDVNGRVLLSNPACQAARADAGKLAAEQGFQPQDSNSIKGFTPVEIPLGDDLSALIALPAGESAEKQARLERTLQVLSQSFALVPLGVAAFDLNGQLALFNPALADLLGLDPVALARRPGLDDFLDLLRNRHKLPEPASLRERRDLAVALGGPQPYEADWLLHGGQVLRVRTRPLAGGGRLVLFEDVSRQIGQLQQLAAEAGIARAIIERIPGGIAVFDPAGRLVTANPGLQALWGGCAEDQPDSANINALTSLWRSRCLPSPFWGDLRDMVAGGAEREAWSEPVRLLAGKTLSCSVAPLPDGSTLVQFFEDAVQPVAVSRVS